MPRKKTRAYSRKPTSDKFIVGMVDTNSVLHMFQRPKVHNTYDEAVKQMEELYLKYPHNKWVVFAKVCTVYASVPPAKVVEYKL